jgi:hypothetical protein
MADSTNSQIGSGVTLAYWGGSPATYTDLGPVRSINGIGVTNPEVDSTTLSSSIEETIAGLPKGKTVTIVFTTSNANHDVVEAFATAKAPVQLRVAFPAPLTKTRYFTITPLDFDEGTITPSGLLEMTLQGRITGTAPTAVNPHA